MALYRGWDRDVVMEGASSLGDATSSEIPYHSSFTPINRPRPDSANFLTPDRTATVDRSLSRPEATHQHPMVAEYLALGSETDSPTPFDRNGPTLISQGTKRNRTQIKAAGEAKRKKGTSKVARKQPRASEGLRVTKSSVRVSSRKRAQNNDPVQELESENRDSGSHLPSPEVTANRLSSFPPGSSSDSLILTSVLGPSLAGTPNSKGLCNSSQARQYASSLTLSPSTLPAQKPARERSSQAPTSWQENKENCRPHHSSQPRVPDTNPEFDEEFEAIFSSLDFDDFTNNDNVIDDSHAASNTTVQQPQTFADALIDEESFDDGLDDGDFLTLTTTHNDSPINTVDDIRSSHSIPLTNVTTPTQDKLPVPRGPSAQFISPVTQKTLQYLQKAHDPNANLKPIVRPPFAQQVRDRSPIIGLSANTLLRTCFRIGEAINTGRSAVRDGKNVVIELYARVLNSHRDESAQFFTFCDLYHTKPPYIKGVYSGAIWKGVELFDYDAGRLLQEQRICRVVGKMKRDGQEWHLAVLNIWEATWEDISWVQGVVNA